MADVEGLRTPELTDVVVEKAVKAAILDGAADRLEEGWFQEGKFDVNARQGSKPYEKSGIILKFEIRTKEVGMMAEPGSWDYARHGNVIGDMYISALKRGQYLVLPGEDSSTEIQIVVTPEQFAKLTQEAPVTAASENVTTDASRRAGDVLER